MNTLRLHLLAVTTALALGGGLPSAALAQGGTSASEPAAKAAKRPRREPMPPGTRRVASPPVVEPDLPLTPDELAVADRVMVGELACELGNNVRLERDPQSPGYFKLTLQKLELRMRPVVSRTGAVRLEDRAQGAVWLQLSNKSMLMSQTQGRRLADECAGDEQRAVAEALRRNPAPSLLDPTPVPK